MISISHKKDCCGCGACVQKCPKQCISMRADPEGFLYPEVDTAVCVHCGLCEQACPILQAQTYPQPEKAYAAFARDEQLRKQSSSGGVFSLLAGEILHRNGVVFGAAFDGDFRVHHIAVSTEEALEKLRGSKYTQSRIGNAYVEAQSFLKKGKPVLFTGTACQIAGLHTFLGRDYVNLYTADVLCHGVPSPKLWERYLKEQERGNRAKVQQVNFRDKTGGWKNYSVQLQFENGHAYQVRFQEDGYMRLFLSDICLRPACHDCKFKSLTRPSDITIGDCWGVEKSLPELDDDRGTSVVLVRTDKGRALLSCCEAAMRMQEAAVDVLLPPTADSRKSVARHPNRERFFHKLSTGADVKVLVKLLQPGLLRRAVRRCRRLLKRK